MPVTFVSTALDASPNPTLWVDLATTHDATVRCAVGPKSPGASGVTGEWDGMNQFCSILAAQWLTSANRPAAYGVKSLGDAGLKAAAETLIAFNAKGLTAQADYAVATLDGKTTTIEEITDQTPVGTKIWAASNGHCMGVYIDSASTFKFYDPNDGVSATVDRADFLAMMRAFGVNLAVISPK